MLDRALAEGVGHQYLGASGLGAGARTAFAYVRVSSPEQAADARTGLPRELMRIDAYARAQDLHVPRDHIYGDDFTGRAEARPFSDLLLSALGVAPKDERILLVEAVDRLGRNYGVQWILTQQLKRLGVSVRYLREMSEVEQMAWAIAAHIEVQKIGERRRYRNLVKMRQGELAQFRAPFGYRMHLEAGKRTFLIHEPAAEIVRLVHELFSRTGLTGEVRKELFRRHISSPLGKPVWSINFLRNLLNDETYAGWHIQNRRVVELVDGYTRGGRPRTQTSERPEEEWHRVAVPQIVSREVFFATQKVLAFRQKRQYHKSRTLLRSLLRCGNCGRALTVARGSGGDYYHCPRRTNNVLARHGTPRCDLRDVKINDRDP